MKVDLAVPWFSQLNNVLNPSGACNVTSCAMVAHYHGIRGNGEGQLEDQMYKRCLEKGWSRHEAFGLAKLLNSYSLVDTLNFRGTFDAVRQSILDGKPIILHGYFTRFGHIIVVRGFDDNGLIVNDPFGEYFASGYNTKKKGEKLHYSYDLIARTCSPESPKTVNHLLMHSVGRKK